MESGKKLGIINLVKTESQNEKTGFEEFNFIKEENSKIEPEIVKV